LARGQPWRQLQAGDDTSFSLKIVGALSLICWAGMLYFARMMPYIGAPESAGF
jgi:ABC-type phosphate transport system auxiliary subunit